MSSSGNLVAVVPDSKRGTGIDMKSNGEGKASVPWGVALTDCTSVNSTRVGNSVPEKSDQIDISFA